MAFLLDLLIRLGILLALAMALSSMGKLGGGLFLLGFFCVEWLYPIVFELSRWAATPGKRALGLRVCMDTGLPITTAASFTRNLLRVADFLPFAYAFGMLSLLLNRDCKRLGDLAAGTVVVHERVERLHDAPPQVGPLAPARPLSAREQAAILVWAGRARRLTPARFEELARLAAPALPPLGQRDDAAPRLLGVAQWLLGKRP
jgi:uncharacterized RDD family membrane protein YckC